MNNEKTCPDCGGTGLLWSELLQEEDCCPTCLGEGVIEQQSEEKLFGNEKLTRNELNENNQPHDS